MQILGSHPPIGPFNPAPNYLEFYVSHGLKIFCQAENFQHIKIRMKTSDI